MRPAVINCCLPIERWATRVYNSGCKSWLAQEDDVSNWMKVLNGDPLPWLLGDDVPSVKHLALVSLLDRAADDPEVVRARQTATAAHPIAAILAAQHPDGYWVKPGHGYGPKYTGTVWNLIFL